MAVYFKVCELMKNDANLRSKYINIKIFMCKSSLLLSISRSIPRSLSSRGTYDSLTVTSERREWPREVNTPYSVQEDFQGGYLNIGLLLCDSVLRPILGREGLKRKKNLEQEQEGTEYSVQAHLKGLVWQDLLWYWNQGGDIHICRIMRMSHLFPRLSF